MHIDFLDHLMADIFGEKLSKLGLVVEPHSSREFESMVNAELEKWAEVVSRSNGAIAKQ